MIRIVDDIKDANFITHSGTMHADEVFATAFLSLYLGDIDLFRITQVNPLDYPEAIIYDVGRGEFDHHQEDRRVRENGIPYCSFGLLWDKYGMDFLALRNIENIEEVFNYIDKDFIEGIDAIDNGIFPKVEAPYKIRNICDVIKLFNPSFESEQSESEQFLKAVDVAVKIFEEEIVNAVARVKARKIVETKIEEGIKNHYLLLDHFMPYEEVVFKNDPDKEIYFAVYPSNRGGYAAKTIPVAYDDKTDRVPFPEEWAGHGEELAEISGVEGATFCHLARFLVCANTLDAVLKLVSITIDKSNEVTSEDK